MQMLEFSGWHRIDLGDENDDWGELWETLTDVYVLCNPATNKVSTTHVTCIPLVLDPAEAIMLTLFALLMLFKI